MSQHGPTTQALVLEALAEMGRNGYEPNELIPNGTIQRFGRKKVQWYVAFLNHTSRNEPFLIVVYGDWSTAESKKFSSKGAVLGPEDRAIRNGQIERAQRESEKHRRVLHEETAAHCLELWNSLNLDMGSEYLKRKLIPELFGARTKDGVLYVPCYDENGKLWSLQKIYADGVKRFIKNGKTRGCFHIIGEPHKTTTLLIAEGFATAASIHIATSLPVAVSFSAGNLQKVSEALAAAFPESNLIICADNDCWKGTGDESRDNAGIRLAKKAARSVNAKVIIPSFRETATKPTDFSDLHLLEGVEAVGEQILSAINSPEETKTKPSQSTQLIQLCQNLELFSTPDDEAYATISVSEHRETWPLKSSGFRSWLSKEFYKKHRVAPATNSLNDAMSVLKGRAIFEEARQPVFLRIGELNDRIYIDLANKNWEAIEVSDTGWRVIQDVPVKFHRPKGMLPLPTPTTPGCDDCVELLRPFLNVETNDDFALIVAWLLNAFQPHGPFLGLALCGEQGSAKSNTVKVLRSFIDPNCAPLRREPRNADDLMVSAKNNWTVVIDNVSSLRDELSDDLCRLATEGALSKRELYSNDEETIIKAKRPIVLNGISDFVHRGDLASRLITLHLPAIPAHLRRRESELSAALEKVRPKILGVLLNAVSSALGRRHQLQLTSNHRMADAWHWITAAESAFGWEPGRCLSAFASNQKEANRVVLDSSPLFPTLLGFLRDKRHWSGTASDLLNYHQQTSTRQQLSKAPHFTPRTIADELRRIVPALRTEAIEVTFVRSHGSHSKRLINITRAED